MKLAPYRKTVVAVVGAVLGWTAMVIASESSAITAAEWQVGATMLATALGVYAVANKPA